MLKRLLIVFCLIIPPAAQANCNRFDANTQTLQVGMQPANAMKIECGASGYAVNESVSAQAAKNPQTQRSTTEKIRAFSDLRRQAEYLGSTQNYYGQR
jgi:hypothetical protein